MLPQKKITEMNRYVLRQPLQTVTEVAQGNLIWANAKSGT